MKILGIVGSPRKGGNTDVLIDRVLEGAKSRKAEVEKVYLRDLDINPCQGGFTCEIAGKCPIPDDMQQLYPKIQEAGCVVIGSPVYVGNVSGPVVNFLDRCRPFLSYLDALGLPQISPSEEKALRGERICLKMWKGEPYSESASLAENIMSKAIHAYTGEGGPHPRPARRLETGKKGITVLSYHQMGEEIYRSVMDFLAFNLRNIWGLEIVDTIPAYRVLKKGDAQMRDDFMRRAFEAGQRAVE